MLSQDNGNEYITNIWWFRKIVLWIVDIFMEYVSMLRSCQRTIQARNAQYVEINIKTEENIEDCIYARKQGGKSIQILM